MKGRGVGPGGSLMFELFMCLALESRKYTVNANRDRKNIQLGKYSIFESQRCMFLSLLYIVPTNAYLL